MCIQWVKRCQYALVFLAAGSCPILLSRVRPVRVVVTVGDTLSFHENITHIFNILLHF